MNEDRGKSGLFLIEILIVIAVFAVCAAICVRIFTEAYTTGTTARDTGRALNIAKSAAEAFKATGDAVQSAYLAGGSTVYTDTDTGEVFAVSHYNPFTVYFTPVEDAPVPTCLITVMADGEELASLKAASRAEGVPHG